MSLHQRDGWTQEGAPKAFVDLHSHTSSSFDSLSDPIELTRSAAARGITHLAITDHDRVDGAQRARDAQIPGITVLVGSEVRTRDGDLIALFIERPIKVGLPPAEAAAAIREQGGLVGIPHPFDGTRGSLLLKEEHSELITLVDWIEGWNARLLTPGGNARAATLAATHGIPSVASSDAHSIMEIGNAATILDGDPSTPALMRAALAAPHELITGRGSLLARLVMPFAKVINATRGNRRIKPGFTYGEQE
ncbi:MAG: PHP-associated domain-containing protein [Candidatus Limnocylindrus sp.]